MACPSNHEGEVEEVFIPSIFNLVNNFTVDVKKLWRYPRPA